METLPSTNAPALASTTSLTQLPETVARDQNPAAVYLARLAPGSRRAMRAALETLAIIAHGPGAAAETFPWAALRYQHTQALRTALAARYAPSTANRQLSGLRGVLREAWRLGAMTAEDYRRAADLEPVRAERLPAGREVTAGELRALFVACGEDPTPAGARDAAILAVLYGGGLRRSEAVAVDLADFNPESGELRGPSDHAPDDGLGGALRTPEASNPSRGRAIHSARSSPHVHLPSSRRRSGSRYGAAPRGSLQCDDDRAV